MTDLALIWNPGTGQADLAIANGGLATDAGLRTAVLVSLFTDRQARPDDVLPAGSIAGGGDRRGWWGDAAPRVAGDQIGSRLWLLAREKRSQATLNRARDYAREALAWLIADGVAGTVEIEAEAQDRGGALVLAIGVIVTRPDGRLVRFDSVWSAT